MTYLVICNDSVAYHRVMTEPNEKSLKFKTKLIDKMTSILIGNLELIYNFYIISKCYIVFVRACQFNRNLKKIITVAFPDELFTAKSS